MKLNQLMSIGQGVVILPFLTKREAKTMYVNQFISHVIQHFHFISFTDSQYLIALSRECIRKLMIQQESKSDRWIDFLDKINQTTHHSMLLYLFELIATEFIREVNDPLSDLPPSPKLMYTSRHIQDIDWNELLEMVVPSPLFNTLYFQIGELKRLRNKNYSFYMEWNMFWGSLEFDSSLLKESDLQIETDEQYEQYVL